MAEWRLSEGNGRGNVSQSHNRDYRQETRDYRESDHDRYYYRGKNDRCKDDESYHVPHRPPYDRRDHSYREREYDRDGSHRDYRSRFDYETYDDYGSRESYHTSKMSRRPLNEKEPSNGSSPYESRGDQHNMETRYEREVVDTRYGTYKHQRADQHGVSDETWEVGGTKDDSLSEDSSRRNHKRYYRKDDTKTTIKRAKGTDDNQEESNSSTILVRNLGASISSEDVETVVSDTCIKNGFSAPNSVTVKMPQSGYTSASEMYQAASQDGYAFGAAVERYAVVVFSSPENAARFMECVSSRKLDINGVGYYVEYDILDVNADKSQTKALTYEDLNELDILLKKRAKTSDWMCPNCSFVNFSRRDVCLTCKRERPSDEVLQQQQALLEAATNAQAQLISSTVTDLAPWVVLKAIPLDADPAMLVHLICSTIPGTAEHLQRCTYVIDTQPYSRCGFMFCQFSTIAPIEKYMEKQGNKISEIIPFQGGYLRLDTVKSREKQVAEELLKNIKTNTIKVNYEFNTDTLEMSLITEQSANKKALNKEIRSCRTKTTNIGAVEKACSGPYAPLSAQQYLNSWLIRSISVPTGKPDTTKMTYDPKSDYFYDYRLGVYYDAATDEYISVCGVRYTWDEAASSIVMKEDDPEKAGRVENPSTVQGNAAGANVAGLLEAALKAAQMTNETSKKSSTTQDMQKTALTKTKPEVEVLHTFERLQQSEAEEEEKKYTEVASKCVDDIAPISSGDCSVGKAAAPEIKPLIVCLVCLRMFDQQIGLEIHERRSAYHRAMLEEV